MRREFLPQPILALTDGIWQAHVSTTGLQCGRKSLFWKTNQIERL